MQDLLIPHLLDPMHIEKNVCAALFKTFSNCKGTKADSIGVRNAFKENGMRPDLHPHEDGRDNKGNLKYKYAKAPWIWTTDEYDSVIHTITSTQTPTGYGSSFSSKFSDRKIVGMKTHDYHNLLHGLLPLAIRGTLTKEIHDIIYRLGSLFKWICSKEIRKIEIMDRKVEAAELLCLMELHLPPSIFDIQFHLIVHLVEEVELAGPVSARWMYFLERYMKTLKGFVRQKARPEGSMSEGYIVSEAMFYITEFVQHLYTKAPRLWESEEDVRLSGIVLPKMKSEQVLKPILREQVHRFLLKNSPALESWRDR